MTYYLGDRLVGNKYGSILQYAHVDHLGSLAARSDSAGNGAWRAYFPYGSLRVTSGSFAGDRSFTGQRLDIPTGMYFYGARYFDTTLGRFVSPDPTMPDPAQPTDLNRFAYVRNNPLRYIDPTGLYCTTADSWSLSGGRCTDPAFGSWQPANAVPESSPDGRPLSRGVQAPHFPIANDGWGLVANRGSVEPYAEPFSSAGPRVVRPIARAGEPYAAFRDRGALETESTQNQIPAIARLTAPVRLDWTAALAVDAQIGLLALESPHLRTIPAPLFGDPGFFDACWSCVGMFALGATAFGAGAVLMVWGATTPVTWGAVWGGFTLASTGWYAMDCAVTMAEGGACDLRVPPRR